MADVSEPGDLYMAISFVEISQLYKATPPHPHTPPRPPHSFWIPETAPCLCSFLPNMGQHWLPLICSLYGSPVSHLEPTSPSCLEPNRVSLLCSSEAFKKQTPGQDSVSMVKTTTLISQGWLRGAGADNGGKHSRLPYNPEEVWQG